jgi:hypothetical protein
MREPPKILETAEAWQNQRMTQTTKKRATHKTLIWAGLVLWLGSALLFALNTGPLKATPLQVTAVIGFVLFVVGGVMWLRARKVR